MAIGVVIAIIVLLAWAYNAIDEAINDVALTQRSKRDAKNSNLLSYWDFHKKHQRDARTNERVMEHSGCDKDGNYFIYTINKDGKIVSARYFNPELRDKPVNFVGRRY